MREAGRIIKRTISMRKKTRPQQPRTPQDYLDAADNALELAKALAGEGDISDQNFLERMARSDELSEHDGQTCGQCYHTRLGAQVAREMIEGGEYEDVVQKWTAETERRWKKSKFFQLWVQEERAGRDPRKAFEERGWEP